MPWVHTKSHNVGISGKITLTSSPFFPAAPGRPGGPLNPLGPSLPGIPGVPALPGGPYKTIIYYVQE